jgi:hypothetical protein
LILATFAKSFDPSKPRHLPGLFCCRWRLRKVAARKNRRTGPFAPAAEALQYELEFSRMIPEKWAPVFRKDHAQR